MNYFDSELEIPIRSFSNRHVVATETGRLTITAVEHGNESRLLIAGTAIEATYFILAESSICRNCDTHFRTVTKDPLTLTGAQ